MYSIPTFILIFVFIIPTHQYILTYQKSSWRNHFRHNLLMSEKHENIELKFVTFNILAPCYNKLSSTKKYESENESVYVARNLDICRALLEVDADIICLQEYWTQNNKIRQLFQEHFEEKYIIKELPRTSHWKKREDGLALLVKKDKLIVQDCKDILFHDAGDRVAQLLLLGLKSPTQHHTNSEIKYHQFLCVNTHLLFPHNTFSTNIRVREVSKILDFIESYKQNELCESICGRSDVRLPIFIAGDFNGSPRGSVFKLMKSQNYRSAQQDMWDAYMDEEIITPIDIKAPSTTTTISSSISSGSSSGSEDRTHEGYTDKSNTSAGTKAAVATVVPHLSSIQSPNLQRNATNHNLESKYMELSTAASDSSSTTTTTTATSTDKATTTTALKTTATTATAVDTTTATTTIHASHPHLLHVNHTNDKNTKWGKWVTHKSHRTTIVPVDHVFYSNPNDQIESKLPALPDWTNLVYRELRSRLIELLGTANMNDAFSMFDQDNSSSITKEEFKTALEKLGFQGDGTAALTSEEVDVLIESADLNGDGLIDYREFCDRLWGAMENTTMPKGIKSMKKAYQRSKWLRTPLLTSNNVVVTNNEKFNDVENNGNNVDNNVVISDADNSQNTVVMKNKDEEEPVDQGFLELQNFMKYSKPLHHVQVKQVTLYPKEMEEGIWPSNYTLSDHGLVEVIFDCEIRY